MRCRECREYKVSCVCESIRAKLTKEIVGVRFEPVNICPIEDDPTDQPKGTSAREFKLASDSMGFVKVTMLDDRPLDVARNEIVIAIEKSAYDSVVKERDELKAKYAFRGERIIGMEKQGATMYDEIIAERDSALTELDGAKAGLETSLYYYTKLHASHTAALAELEELKASKQRLYDSSSAAMEKSVTYSNELVAKLKASIAELERDKDELRKQLDAALLHIEQI